MGVARGVAQFIRPVEIRIFARRRSAKSPKNTLILKKCRQIGAFRRPPVSTGIVASELTAWVINLTVDHATHDSNSEDIEPAMDEVEQVGA